MVCAFTSAALPWAPLALVASAWAALTGAGLALPLEALALPEAELSDTDCALAVGKATTVVPVPKLPKGLT
jgi:hypothetical protein